VQEQGDRGERKDEGHVQSHDNHLK